MQRGSLGSEDDGGTPASGLGSVGGQIGDLTAVRQLRARGEQGEHRACGETGAADVRELEALVAVGAALGGPGIRGSGSLRAGGIVGSGRSAAAARDAATVADAVTDLVDERGLLGANDQQGKQQGGEDSTHLARRIRAGHARNATKDTQSTADPLGIMRAYEYQRNATGLAPG